MKDKKLVEMIMKEPDRGITAAVDLYGGTVKAVCSSVLRGCKAEDVEEACSDTFVKLWKCAKQFDETRNASLKTYICTIARSVSLDLRRRKSEEALIDLSEYDMADASVNLENDFSKKQCEEIIHQAIGEMEEPDRTIFILRYFYFYTVKEIAEKLELKPKQIENILYRRKEKLKKVLIERGVLYEEVI